MTIGNAGRMLILALAMTAANPCVASETQGRREGADGKWVELFYFPVGIGCPSVSTILVPNEDLVITASGGGFCAPFRRRRLSSPFGPPVPAFEGPEPDGIPVGAIADPARDRILFFMSGFDGQSATETTTWSLDLKPTLRWRRLETLNAPRARPGWSIVLDRREDRLLFYGGRTSGTGLSGDVWVLLLSDLTWMPLVPHGAAPQPRADQSAIYDPDGQRMVVYGGWSGSTPLGDVWELSLGKQAAWRVLKTRGDAPPPRYAHAALFDPVGSRMLVFGGITTAQIEPQGFTRDTWELPLRGSMAWRQLQPANAPPNVYSAWTGVAYDAARDRMLVGDVAGVSALEWGRGVGPHVAEATEGSWSPQDENASAAPARSATDPIRASSLDEELRLYDVSGRVVLSRTVDDAEKVLRTIRSGSLAELATLRRGVYFARKRDRTGAVTVTRIVLLTR